MKKNTAICHWAEEVAGGGERVAWELARTFEAPLFVGSRDKHIEPDDIEINDAFDSKVVNRMISHGGILCQLAQQAGWGSAHQFREFNQLVTSGNDCLAFVPSPDQVWIHYTHHTKRIATDRLPEIENNHLSLFGSITKRAEYLLRWLERQIYGRYAQKPTLLVANSEPVAERIRTYWGVPDNKIRVVYPPVDTENYSPDHAQDGDYYLTLSRLSWNKNTDEIISAFNEIDQKLIVAGDGPERKQLETIADENVEFAGYVSEERKRELLAGAKAFVFAAQTEDFGLVWAEALASGTPVVTVKEGFPQYVIRDGLNGYLFERGVENLRETILRFETEQVSWSAAEIERFADQFSIDRFRREMSEVMSVAEQRKQINTKLSFETIKESVHSETNNE